MRTEGSRLWALTTGNALINDAGISLAMKKLHHFHLAVVPMSWAALLHRLKRLPHRIN
jgi:hypothetical protein